MSYAELVAKPTIDSEEVHQLLGHAEEIIDLSPQVMSAKVEEWRRGQLHYLGEVVIPQVVEFDAQGRSEHGVYWLRRVGYSENFGEAYDYYQLACDHIPEAELDDTYDRLFSCRALHRVLQHRAEMVDAAFRHSDTLVQHTNFNHQTHGLELNSAGESLAGDYILAMLDHTNQHPSVWLANHLGGSHNIGALALLLGLEPRKIEQIAKKLEDRGQVGFDTETSIRLSDEYRLFMEQFADQPSSSA